MKNKPTMRKIFNLIQIVLLLVALVMILTCDYGDFKQYEFITDHYDGYTVRVTEAIRYSNQTPINEGTITFSTLNSGNPLWATLTLALTGLCILISLASVIRKSNHRDGLLHLFLPIPLIFAYFSFSMIMLELSGNMREGCYTIYENCNIQKVVLGIFIAVEFLAFVKRSRLFNPKETVQVEITNQNNAPASNADELKKYKELLDTGVISQEEFEAKKKQLLGL